jgi:catechol 2,3-dioxygenase-like lactoylglutathione lyase family enzyme
MVKKGFWLSCLFVAAAGALQSPVEPPDPGMKTLVQVAIVTRNAEATARQWAAVLGVPVPKINLTRPGQEVKVVYRGRPSGGQAKIAFFRLGQVALEILEPVGEGTSWREFLDRHGEGVQHIAFQVNDLDGSLRRLEKLGLPVVHRGRYDADNGTYVYLDSEKALGVTLELLHSDPKP